MNVFFFQPRHFRARQKSSEIRRMSVSSDASSAIDNKHHNEKHSKSDSTQPIPHHNEMQSGSDSESENKPSPSKKIHIDPANIKDIKHKIKSEIKKEFTDDELAGTGTITTQVANFDEQNASYNLTNIKRRKSDDGSMCSSVQDSIVDASEHSTNVPRKKSSVRAHLAQQIVASSNKQLKKGMHVVRPHHASSSSSSVISQAGNNALDPTCLLLIFRYLPQEALVSCSLVCKIWSNVSVDPALWKKMNCSQNKLSASLLTAIVRRQPEHLILDWTSLAKRQLAWVIARIPGLKHLSLQGTPIQAALGLHTCLCPPLQILDISFVRGLNDSAIRDILAPPKDSRPGLTDSKSRLRNLRSLKIAGTDISDIALRYITQGLPSLIHLDLSSCQRITDAGIAQIGTCQSAINTLIELDLSSCKLITELSLEYLMKCEALIKLDLRHVPQVSTQAVIKFAAKSKNNLQVQDIKLVDKRRSN